MERYIIEVIVFQGFFLLIYQLLLKKETFFTYNRAYLLLTPILAVVLPFMEIEALEPAIAAQQFFTQLPTVFIGASVETIAPTEIQNNNTFTISWSLIYFIGIGISLLIWFRKYFKINRFYRFQNSKQSTTPRVIQIPNSDVAFSFLKTIFIGEKLDTLSRKQILSHELIHVNQGHTWDLLLFEVLRVIFWFNPLIILFQKHIAVVHEYIADAAVVGDAQDTQKKAYYNELLNTTFGTSSLSFTNTFFNHSLIKKRIIMLQKSRSKKITKIKYLSIIPLILGILVYVSCVQDEGVQPANTIIESSSLIGDLPPPPPPPPPVDMEWLQNFTAGWSKGSSWEAIEYQLNEKGFQIGEETPMGLKSQEVYGGLGSLLMMPPREDKIHITENEYTRLVYLLRKNLGLDKDIIEIEEVPLEEVVLEDVPFEVVERVPTFPGCDAGLSNEARKECMSNSIKQYVSKTFNTNIGKNQVLSGINRVFVVFKIDKNGNVVNVKSRAAVPALEEEAKRVINGLPQMVPGEQDGQPVDVLYTLPITYKVE